jgi:hypothetical protein
MRLKNLSGTIQSSRTPRALRNAAVRSLLRSSFDLGFRLCLVFLLGLLELFELLVSFLDREVGILFSKANMIRINTFHYVLEKIKITLLGVVNFIIGRS